MSASPDISADPCPPVTILLDPDDDYGTVQAVLRAHNPAQGMVAVDPTVGTSAMAALAQDLLVALGKDPSIVANSRAKPAALWTAATAWLAGTGVRRLVILRAHRLPRHALARLMQLAVDARTALTLVWHAPVPPAWDAVLPRATLTVLHDTAASITAETAAPPRAQAVMPKAEAPCQGCVPLLSSQQAKRARRLFAQELPDFSPSDVLHFRADAARELSREDFDRVDLLYTYGMDAACAFMSTEFPGSAMVPGAEELPAPRSPDGTAIPDSQVAARIQLALDGIDRQVCGLPSTAASLPQPMPCITSTLRHFLVCHIAGSPTKAHTIAILRGAQAGFLLHGVHLTLPTRPQHLVGPGFADPVFTTEVAERIRSRILDPAHAGALTAVLATGISAFDVTLLSLRKLAPDAATLECHTRIDDVPYPIPRWGRDLLAAARAFAVLHGDHNFDSFLATGVGVQGQTLAATAQACDLQLNGLVTGDQYPWYSDAECLQVADLRHPRTPAEASSLPQILP